VNVKPGTICVSALWVVFDMTDHFIPGPCVRNEQDHVDERDSGKKELKRNFFEPVEWIHDVDGLHNRHHDAEEC
jgi:hypothetical protein